MHPGSFTGAFTTPRRSSHATRLTPQEMTCHRCIKELDHVSNLSASQRFRSPPASTQDISTAPTGTVVVVSQDWWSQGCRHQLSVAFRPYSSLDKGATSESFLSYRASHSPTSNNQCPSPVRGMGFSSIQTTRKFGPTAAMKVSHILVCPSHPTDFPTRFQGFISRVCSASRYCTSVASNW